MRGVCCALGCTNTKKNSSDLVFFKLPLNYPERCEEWLLNLGRQDLLNKVSPSLRVCAKHFDDYQFTSSEKKWLIRYATPTSMECQEEGEFGGSLAEVCWQDSKGADEDEDDDDSAQDSVSLPLSDHGQTTDSSSGSRSCSSQSSWSSSSGGGGGGESATSPDARTSTSSRLRTRRGRRHPKGGSLAGRDREDIDENHRPPPPPPPPPLPRTPRKMNMLKRKVCSLKKRVDACFQSRSKGNKATQAALIHLKSKLPGPLFNIVSSRVTAAIQQQKSNGDSGGFESNGSGNWSQEDRLLALNVYLISPRAYRVVEKLFNLPSRRALTREIRTIGRHTGFCPMLLAILRERLRRFRMPYCVLTFAEVPLRPRLAYDRAADRIDGFEDYGFVRGRTPNHANRALVFAARGLCERWRQPLGYFFCHNTAPDAVLRSLIAEAVCHLETVGLHVAGVVAGGQGADAMRAFAELGASEARPHFEANGHRVYTLYDPLHLLRGVFNMFRRYDVEFNGGKVARYRYIRSMLEHDELQRYRLVPPSSPTSLPSVGMTTTRGRGRSAPDVLSHQVAAAVAFMASLGALPDEADYTADYVASLADMFDSIRGPVPGTRPTKKVSFRAASDGSSTIPLTPSPVAPPKTPPVMVKTPSTPIPTKTPPPSATTPSTVGHPRSSTPATPTTPPPNADPWRRFVKCVHSWRFLKPEPSSPHHHPPQNIKRTYVQSHCKNGWIHTLNAASLLWEDLRERGVQLLTLGHVALDDGPLRRSLRRSVRHRRRQDNFGSRPTTAEFKSRMHAVVARNILEEEEDDEVSLEADQDAFFLAINMGAMMPLNSSSAGLLRVDSVRDHHENIVCGSNGFGNGGNYEVPSVADLVRHDLIADSNVAYLAGFIALRVAEVGHPTPCEQCRKLLTFDDDYDVHYLVPFVTGNFDHAASGTLKPSPGLAGAVSQLLDSFKFNYDILATEDGVGRRMKEALASSVGFDWLAVHPEHYAELRTRILRLFVGIMIGHRLEQFNRKFEVLG